MGKKVVMLALLIYFFSLYSITPAHIIWASVCGLCGAAGITTKYILDNKECNQKCEKHCGCLDQYCPQDCQNNNHEEKQQLVTMQPSKQDMQPIKNTTK